ncbi:C2H2 type zinc-finger-domain-containing protein [Daldinia vernicosa]|uniref:C2H2 type zinc-finger-domain-containing protein n=1 Tax=Daldinia vernicosa TaxID=114800 RepID=UPI0020073B28|nr:C2H2 type zinc-finger-domain-containing protein [Daldinia vernicosa]KAI0846076.1 C2H2 type zinc-finger-domain-containing protein [Daldinia vernicosa]
MVDTTTTNTSAVSDQPPLTIAKPPSFCRLCNAELSDQQTWKAHLKSDEHVYKLRLKVAEPGSVTSPPPAPSTDADQTKSTAPSHARRRDEPDVGADQDQDAASDTEDETGDELEDELEEPSAPDFDSGSCLFCAQESNVLDDNMTHMAVAHGFNIPFQEFLAVDPETVVEYLHFIIFGYRECICCGTRRSTIEGVQQHMVAKGHCRFDISIETEEFYEMPQSENAVIEQAQHGGSTPVRLPSGKLISHRKNPDNQDPQAKPRPARRETPDRQPTRPLDSFTSRPGTSSTPSLEVAQRGGSGSGSGEIVRSSEAILAAQLSKLRIAGDRIQHKEEKRKRWRLERAQNIISLKRFKLDSADGRMGRQF